MQKDSSFRRNLIIIGCCWAAIFMFVLGGIVGATLSPSSTRITTPAPANTTTSPLCPRQWVSGVGWVAIVHTKCDIYTAAMGVDSQTPLPKTCTGIDIVTGEAIPAGCARLGSQRFATTNTGSTAITPPAPVSTPAQCQAQHYYYTPQGCIGSNGNGTTTNTGNTGSTAITPPPAPTPVYGHVDCPDHEIYTTQGCVGELSSGTVAIPPPLPHPSPGKCVKTSATTWTCTVARPVTG